MKYVSLDAIISPTRGVRIRASPRRSRAGAESSQSGRLQVRNGEAIVSHSSLTDEQAQHFLDHGYVVIKNCFTREDAKPWIDFAWKRLGLDRDDPSGWDEPRMHLPVMNRAEIKDLAPKAWGAICDLVGGPEAVKEGGGTWGDGFIINFGMGADTPWIAPDSEQGGWHRGIDLIQE